LGQNLINTVYDLGENVLGYEGGDDTYITRVLVLAQGTGAESASAVLCVKKPFVCQHCNGFSHSMSAQGKLFSQFIFRGNLVTWHNSAGKHFISQIFH
jgi:hypothetical protein